MDSDSDTPASSLVPPEFLVLACADVTNTRERKDSQNELVNNEGSFGIQNCTNEFNAQRWDLNYYEASIYLNEGKDNDKFSVHPRDQYQLPIYKIVHSTWFHTLNLLASIGLLALAMCESPTDLQFPVSAHAVLELLGLTFISLELFLKVRWLGLKTFATHRRTMFKVSVLIVMFVEAIVVIIRQSNHIRVTRALRPVFLLDSHYCRGVRRFIRQILQTVPSILRMLVFIFLFLSIFSMIGFFLFSSNPKDAYFRTFIDSFISLFILMTTSNYPDVMMPSYKASKWSCIYFITYISLQLFIFMNLFIAVVYSEFLKIEKEKFKKLFIHKREACKFAFNLLVSAKFPEHISFRHFKGCLKYFQPRMSLQDVYLTFKSLDTNNNGVLSLDEFMNIYQHVKFNWKMEKPEIRENNQKCWLKYKRYIKQIATSRWFNYFINAIILLNFLWVLVDVFMKSLNNNDWMATENKFFSVSIAFVVIYTVEMILRMIALGLKDYFSSGWRIYDFAITITAIVGLILEIAKRNSYNLDIDNNNSFYIIVILRPLRIVRLFKMKKSFRDIFGTLFILLPRMISLAIAMLLLYYIFAIVGMEMFAPYTSQLKDCCKNSSVRPFFVFNDTDADGYYYLNSFENIFVSGVTLFELTVVNNWWIIMEGFAYVVSPWCRLYFMTFYIIVMIVMAVVVAFILEAFIFRIQYRHQMEKETLEVHASQKVTIDVTPEELTTYCYVSPSPIDGPHRFIRFHGKRRMCKSDFSLRMYLTEVKEWLLESNFLQQTTSTPAPTVNADHQVQPTFFPNNHDNNYNNNTLEPNNNINDNNFDNINNGQNDYSCNKLNDNITSLDYSIN